MLAGAHGLLEQRIPRHVARRYQTCAGMECEQFVGNETLRRKAAYVVRIEGGR